MTYTVIFIATRWGSELGGLNVFNTGIARGTSRILPRGSRCICYVDKLPTQDFPPQDSILIRLTKPSARDLANDIIETCKSYDTEAPQGILIVGHDVKTGKTAIDCANELKNQLSPTIIHSAIISHMNYQEYGKKKGYTLTQTIDRSNEQHQIISLADHAFAVGPLLEESFRSARTYKNGLEKTPIKGLVPGAAEIQIAQKNNGPGLQVFIAGRLNIEDDSIKNGILTIESLLESYQQGRQQELPIWRLRGKLYACGVDSQHDRALLTSLESRASQESAFEIEAIPFTDNQAEVHKHLATSHFALMPSWHEGFGLTGWEALCAGVPLICSRQSGLAMLLDELRKHLPETSFTSIEYVNLGGNLTPGRPHPSDIRSLKDAIFRITANIDARKAAAVSLARRLKREFTWEKTARDLIEATGWELPSSIRWPARQKYASRSATGAQPDPETADIVANVLESLEELNIERDWSELCTTFNYFSDIGKQAQLTARRALFDQLQAIGKAVANHLPETQLKGREIISSARNSGSLDVCWRYMAACASIATNFGQFATLIDQKMIEVIQNEPFLRKELLYYASRFSSEFSASAKAIAVDFFNPLFLLLDSDPNLQIRMARLASAFPDWDGILPKSENHTEFAKEHRRCTRLIMESHDSGALINEDPSLAPTILALMSLQEDPARQLADQAVGFLADYQRSPFNMYWRGDKRLYAGLVTTGIRSSNLVNILASMAKDEDETIRWAAIDLAFSRTLRARLAASRHTSATSDRTPLNQVLGHIVDSAVCADSGHPWLHREFLQYYLQEQMTSIRNNYPRLTINDFPLSRQLFGPVVGNKDLVLFGSQHPEVRLARADAQEKVKRILLILPPIQLPKDTESPSPAPSQTSTPPLGMGILATYIASYGHDVQLADCHRHPELCSPVLQAASSFNVIGFYTVLSTLRSTSELLKRIRRQTSRTLLVVGGPAAKLDAWQHSLLGDEDRESWDFSISNAALGNLVTLISELDKQSPWPSSPSLIANSHSPVLAARDVSQYQVKPQTQSQKNKEPDWKNIALDRRFFNGPCGQYEPSRTRSKTSCIYEAHVVMSQGCDWNCAFCTERRSMSGGEKRRKAVDVINEIKDLVKIHPNLRIQFIDDNLLPQIAALDQNERIGRAAAIDWTEEFLNGLTQLRSELGSNIGWRGIFRLEDFFEYENQFSDSNFINLLAKSGCHMLAFGVEHGDEDQRRRSKGGVGTRNDSISDLFKRLRDAEIYTKAYFMLGGRWENKISAERTIDFAINSGVTLAYFALYKEFVQASHVLSQQSAGSVDKYTAYLDYRQLVLRWDDELSTLKNGASQTHEAELISGGFTESELENYQKLEEQGFRFADLVKYNDYHSDSGESRDLLSKVSWDQPQEYFRVVEQAYRRFYLRPQFVEDYAKLIELGY